MNERFQVSAQYAGKLEEVGVQPRDVLRVAGLPASFFESPKICCSTDEFFRLWTAIGKVSDDPCIGLRLGAEDRIERYDPIAMAALCARSFGDSLQRMSRYKELTCPEKIELRRGPRECAMEFRWLLAKDPAPETLVDLCFAWVLTIARRGTGIALRPVRVELLRKARNRAEYERFFGAGVEFGATRDALVFRTEDVDLPYTTHNEELLAVVAPALEEQLRRRSAQQSLAEQVRRIVKGRLAGRRPSVAEVARELRMSARTLQRRLLEGGWSYQQLLEESRRELARHYLAHSPLELNETAYLVGFEDTNSFVRAFHSWEGLPPARWREAERSRAGAA